MYASATWTSSDFFECGFGGGRVAATAGSATAAADAEAAGAEAAAIGGEAALGTATAAPDAPAAGAEAAIAEGGGESAARTEGIAAASATKITPARPCDGRVIPLPRSRRGIKQATALTACCTCRSRDRPA